MSHRVIWLRGTLLLILLAYVLALTVPVVASTQAQETDNILPLEKFSPVFLGIYRKLMLIEDQIRTYSDKYDVDYDLARAVCLYESGGNPNLTSIAGAGGYFQVMPATFRFAPRQDEHRGWH